MSNRSKWAHWNKPKPERHPRLMKWGVGVSFILLASTLILSGLKGLGNHIFWYQSFNFHFGRPVVHQTVDLVVFGIGFLFAGIVIVVARK